MEIFILVLLILAGLTLFVIELFVTPGLSIAGIAASICLLYANYYAFTTMGSAAGFITLAITIIGFILFILWFMRSKTLDKLSLHKNIDSTVENEAEKEIREGDEGIAITRLALIGNADINGNIIEVKSMDGFLDEKTPVIVDRIDDGIIIVRRHYIIK